MAGWIPWNAGFVCALIFTLGHFDSRTAMAASEALSVEPGGPGRLQVFAGSGLLTEGDDRIKPAIVVGGVVGPGLYSTLFLYGQRFSIMSKRAQALSLGKRWALPLPFSGRFTAGAGLSLLREETILRSTAASSKQSNTSYNAGVNLALQFRILRISRTTLDLDWSSHVFPAGFATLFLATGRRQMISLTAGVDFP